MRRDIQRSLFILLKKEEIISGSVQRVCKGEKNLGAFFLIYFSPHIHLTKQKTSIS